MKTTRVARELFRAVLQPEYDGRSDAQLLAAFLDHRDEVAFECLVCRHGPMVLAACRRVLGQEQDAEDAFQATFLVLAHKASSIVRKEDVAGWLYGVARNTALKARERGSKARRREQPVADLPDGRAAPSDRPDPDLVPLLESELARLPETQRTALLLCDVDGLTQAEAGRRLGVPEGTVSSRLTRARQALADRLKKRGVTLAVPGGLAVLAPRGAAAIEVPRAVLSAVVDAAVGSAGGCFPEGVVIPSSVLSLKKGVLYAMLIQRLKRTGLALFLAFGICAAAAALQTAAAAPDDPPTRTGEEKARPANKSAPDNEKGKAFRCAGQVTDQATGKPVAGATVLVRWPDRERPTEEVTYTTDAAGKYSFEVPVDRINRHVAVHVAHPEFVSRTAYSSFAGYLRDAAKDSLNVQLDPGEAIAGTVLAPDGKPAVGIQVVAISKKPAEQSVDGKKGPDPFNQMGHWTQTRTDDQGRFRLKLVTPGPAVYWIVPEKLAASEHRLTDKERGDQGKIALSPGLTLTGKVLDIKGKPLAGVNVNATRIVPPELFLHNMGLDDLRLGRSAVTDARGEFSMEGLAPDKYSIKPASEPLWVRHRQWGIVLGDQPVKNYPMPGFFVHEEVTLKAADKARTVEVRAVPTVTITLQRIDADGKAMKTTLQEFQNQIVRGMVTNGEYEKKRLLFRFELDADGRVVVKLPHGTDNVKLIFPSVRFPGESEGGYQYRLKKADKLKPGPHILDLGTVNEDLTIEMYRPDAKNPGGRE